MRPLIASLLFALCIAPAGAQMKIPDPRDDLINDFASIIPDGYKTQIKQVTQPLKAKQTPIVILTVPRLADYRVTSDEIRKFGTNVFNVWGIGSEAAGHKGVLVVVAKEDRKISIILGKGLQVFDGEVTKRIIDNVITPEFKRNANYGNGLLEGVKAIRDRILAVDASDNPDLPVEGTPPDQTATPPVAPEPEVRIDDPASPNYIPPTPRPRVVPRLPGGHQNVHWNFDCGSWFCFAIGVFLVISLISRIFRRRPQYTYGYPGNYGAGGYPPGGSMPPNMPPGMPPYPPPMYQQRSGPGWGGVFGGLLGGMLLGQSLNRRRNSGNIFSSDTSSGTYDGASSGSDWSSGSSGGSDSGGGFSGGDSGGSSFGGGESSGGGADGSW